MNTAQNRFSIGMTVVAVSLVGMLAAQSISYEKLEDKLAIANSSTKVAMQETLVHITSANQQLTSCNDSLKGAIATIESKEGLLRLAMPAVDSLTAITLDCLEQMGPKDSMCMVALYNIAGRGLITGAQL